MKRSWFVMFVLVLVAGVLEIAQAALVSASPFEVVAPAAAVTVVRGQPFTLEVLIRVPPGHYLYAEETELEFQSLEGMLIEHIHYPDPVDHQDPFLDKEVEIFDHDVTVVVTGRVPATAPPGIHELAATMRLRGCTPKLCLRPETIPLLFRLDVQAAAVAGATPATALPAAASVPASSASFWRLLREENLSRAVAAGWGWVFLIAFIAGVLTSLTPCVWPVIPVILLTVGIRPEERLRKNIALALALVAGIVLVYAALGLAAASLGKSLGFLFQNKIFLTAVVVFFLLMSCSMFGLFTIRLPRVAETRLERLGGRGLRGAFVAGLGTGLIASPCVGPVVAGILTYVILHRNYGLGFLLLLVYGAGMGLLFLLLALGAATVTARLKSGPWMVWVKRTLGLLLLLPAFFYAQSLTGFSAARLLSVWSGPGVEWLHDEPTALAKGKELGRPILIDFYADWCPPCRSLDRHFFHRSDIVAKSGELVFLRVDATVETDEVNRLIEKYGVVGWPTVLLLSPSGEVYSDLSVSAFAPDELMASIAEALRRSAGGNL